MAIITNYDTYEFNFVFKNGQTSDAPLSGQELEVVKINPPDSVVKKIIVGYDQGDYVMGFKLFDVNGTCVLEIGGFEW